MAFRKILFRRPFFGLICALNLILLLYIIVKPHSNEKAFFEENYIRVLLNNKMQLVIDSSKQTCQLPIDISPFDSSILPYLKSLPKQIICSVNASNFQSLTFIDEIDGRLKQVSPSYNCYFRLINKNINDDNIVQYSPENILDPVNGLKLDKIENYVQVKCDQDNYENVHFWFNLTSNNNNLHLNSTSWKPSVLILVIESLSRLNYLRYLNETQSILENKYGNLYYLEGLNKMEDNSFVNMVPLLTGKRAYHKELPGDNNAGPYDEWPFIWNDFRRAGYLTAFVEDYSKFSLFNYEAKGFVNGKPTDIYPRPFWTHLFSEVNTNFLKWYPFNLDPCYKNRVPRVDIFFDQIHNFMEQSSKMKIPIFAYTFYIELTHNDFNKVQTLDYHLSKFLKQSSTYLNDTIFILMGDHGNRFGSALQTTIGRVEERMPLFGIHLPERLLRMYPHLGDKLRTNRRRLSTWLDIHRMFVDIANNNFTVNKNENLFESSSSYSPWRENISLGRTCKSALISEQHCACDRRITLDHQTSVLAKDASIAFVSYLNERISHHKECRRLHLDHILKAELKFPSETTAHAKGFQQQIEITVNISPSNGTFQGTLYRTARQFEWKVYKGQVARFDEYGSQSSCVTERYLKKICLCRSFKKNNKI